ncbi:MAG TPA: response regulator [Opitutaceae bacterium]|nr:response regulator [Opitutaceae bacterium]
MKDSQNASPRDGNLRKRAESTVAERAAAGGPLRTESDTQRLLHELQVHEVELEMQNEELREAHCRLETVLQRYTELYDFAPDGYFTVLSDGVIREANLTGARLLRVERSVLLGARLQSFFMPDDHPLIGATLSKVFDTGMRHTCKARLAAAGPRPVYVRLGCEQSHDGRECCVVMEDITALHEAEAERRAIEVKMWQAQKLESLGVLAGGIAHDFNNLLMAILGHASLALEQEPTPARTGECLREIEGAAKRAAELCRQMLAYAGRGRFTVEPVRLSALVEESVRLLRVSVSKQTVLRCELGENLPNVEADPGMLRQVIMNLVINASEAIGDRAGSIRLTTGVMECDAKYLSACLPVERANPGRYSYVEVADTGCGMDAATMARMFDPFFTTKFAGRGLGLAAVQGIIRQHHGALRVESAPGRGTVFRVLLPVTTREAALTAPPVAGAAWQGGGTVLLVDDDESVRGTGRCMLKSWGFAVLEAEDGQRAIEVFRDHADEIRCVLLDFTMPRLDGMETFRELRRLRPNVKAILMSGYSDAELVDGFLREGGVGFLAKPFSAPEANALLKAVLTAENAPPAR